jgi:uncharacterized membrane protein (UPF0127 family)
MSQANKKQRTQVLWLCIAFVVLLIIVIAWYAYSYSNNSMSAMPVSSATSTGSLTGVVVATTTISSTSSPSPYPPPSLGEQQGIVSIDGQTIYTDLAQNPAQQELGLGNRASLGAHQGMLFIFPTNDIHEFWMKDMSFSIDMVWMSADGTIIYIQPNVAPSTYPDAFGPTQVSRYVLELPANFAANNGIKVGDKAVLP